MRMPGWRWLGLGLGLSGLLLALAAWWWRVGAPTEPVRIGVLHALTGTMATSERPLVDAVRLAVARINAEGGLLGRPLELVVADTRSDAAEAARQAQRLIDQEGASVLAGCWTSACRQALLPVLARYRHLLLYPLQYEGMEQSPHVLYTGSAPNQQIVPGVRWALQNLGREVYLVGSDYVFPRTANLIVRDLLDASGARVAGERYVPLGGQDMTALVRDIARVRPELIINTLNGDSNAAFFKALAQAGLGDMPLLSFSVDEAGMRAWGGGALTRHYAAWSYFQSLPGEENQRFVKDYQGLAGAGQTTGDPVEAAYAGVLLWAQAVREAGSARPAQVDPVLLRQSLRGPSGILAVDAATRHLWKNARIGKVRADGQFEQVYATAYPLRPEPWPGYRSRQQWETLRQKGGS